MSAANTVPHFRISVPTPDRTHLPSAFWSGVRALGLTQAQLIAESRLPLSAIEDSRVTVSTAQLFEVWKAISSLHPQPDVGIRFVCNMDVGQSHPVVLAAMQAHSFREAIQSMARYKQLCGGEELRLSESNGELSIEPEWPFAKTAAPEAIVDATFASIMELGRRGTGTHLRPVRVTMRGRSRATQARNTYFGSVVKYGAPRNTLVLRSEDLDLPFRTHNAELAEILAPQLDRHLAERHVEPSTADRVRLIVKRQLSGSQFTVGAVAKLLRTSVRTLQRRITSEGTTFRRIVDEARQELVRQYLVDPEIGIAEAAFLLGYQDTNSFYRAFRAWEGTTPAHWRETQNLAH